MSKKILIDGSRENQAQFALISEHGLEDFEFESYSKKNLKGNIYLGKVSRIEASLQAAFVDIGAERNGFLAFGEIHPNYFQIPVGDREALIAAEAEIEEEYNRKAEHENDNDNDNDEAMETEDAQNANGLTENTIDENNEKKVSKNENKSNSKFSYNLKRKLYRSYKIQEVIKTGQLILVQVVKEERGNKGAALTSYISLAGKYSVLMPNSTKTKGISRKISTFDDRNKIRKIIDELKIPAEMGLIVRTAGLNKTKNEIKKDYTTLKKLWVEIVNQTKKAIAPALIHEEGNLLRRVVRDVYSKEMKEILVEGKLAYQETKKHMSQVLPSCSKFVKQYRNKEPLFIKHKIEEEILKMFSVEVKLRSGGYIVINPTEALVAIDVNSGGATKERNIEKTALKTNLEAVEEIAKQLKIRDLSGLIVIDFIDMYEMRNNRQVERKMKEFVKNDRARIQVSRISQFGLLEMSRQRLRQSFIQWKSQLTNESLVQKLLYQLKENINNNKKAKKVIISINPYINNYIHKNFHSELQSLEKLFNIKIDTINDESQETFEIIFEDKKKLKETTKKKTNKKKTSSAKKKISNATSKKKSSKLVSFKEIKDKKTGWWQK